VGAAAAVQVERHSKEVKNSVTYRFLFFFLNRQKKDWLQLAMFKKLAI
jgi:hypothetical protein